MERPTLLKSGGGPGSGKSRDSTAPIERLEKSPFVTIHRRKKIMNHRSPTQTGKNLSLDSIYFGAQSKYDIEKLGWMLSHVDEWEDEAIDVVRIGGQHHLMDGHHRFLAADRLGMDSIKADVYVMDEDEVRRVTGQKEASKKGYDTRSGARDMGQVESSSNPEIGGAMGGLLIGGGAGAGLTKAVPRRYEPAAALGVPALALAGGYAGARGAKHLDNSTPKKVTGTREVDREDGTTGYRPVFAEKSASISGHVDKIADRAVEADKGSSSKKGSPPIIAGRKYYSSLNDKMVTIDGVGENKVELSTEDSSWTERPDAVREKIREGDLEKTKMKPVHVDKQAAFGLGRIDLPIDRLFQMGEAIKGMRAGSDAARKIPASFGSTGATRNADDLHARVPVGGQSGAGGPHDWGQEVNAPDEINDLYQAQKTASLVPLPGGRFEKQAYGGFLLGDLGKEVVPKLDDIKVPYPDTPSGVDVSAPPSKTGPVGPKDGTAMSMDEARNGLDSGADEAGVGESLSTGGVLGVGLGGAGLAAGMGTDGVISDLSSENEESGSQGKNSRQFQRMSPRPKETSAKQASVSGAIAAGAAGGAAGTGLNYAKQKGAIRSGTQERVDPYRLAQAGTMGAAAGSVAPSAVRMGRRISGDVRTLSRDAKRTMSEARRASRDMQGAADDLGQINRNISSGTGDAQEFMARMQRLADDVSETNQSFRNLADRAENNRFFGFFSKESSVESPAGKTAAKEAAKGTLADAFVEFANKTDAPSPQKFEQFLQDVKGVSNPTVRTRPEKLDSGEMTGENVVFDGRGDGAEMWEVASDEGRQLVPGIKSGGDELDVSDGLTNVTETTNANEVSDISPIDLSNAESAGPDNTQFRLPRTDQAKTNETADAIIGAGLVGGAGYGGYQAYKSSQGSSGPSPRKSAAKSDTINMESDNDGPSLFEEGFDFEMPDPEMPDEMDIDTPEMGGVSDVKGIDPDEVESEQDEIDMGE